MHIRGHSRSRESTLFAGDLLVHPIMLASIFVLLVNDHWLKYAYPGWTTGKLSDLAGLCFFPVLLGAFWQLAVGKFRRLDRVLLSTAFITAAVFAAVQISPTFGALYTTGLGGIQWVFVAPFTYLRDASVPAFQHVALTQDASDLIALPAVFVGVVIARYRLNAMKLVQQRK